MYQGKIVEQGGVEQVLLHPQHPYTRKLVEAVPVIDVG
jgi:ABC-type dipeptide/oligopeptide/nickel transport system ATPase component